MVKLAHKRLLTRHDLIKKKKKKTQDTHTQPFPILSAPRGPFVSSFPSWTPVLGKMSTSAILKEGGLKIK